MKSAIWGLAAVLCLGITSAQAAEPGPYVSGSLGIVSLNDSDYSDGGFDFETTYKSAPIISLAAGYKFGNGVRAEIEISRASIEGDELTVSDGVNTESASLSDAEADATLFTVNGFYDIQTGTIASPYFGGGIGFANVDVDDYEVAGIEFEGDSETDLTAFGEVGVNFAVTEALEIVPSYRFLWINNGEDGVDDTTGHIFKVGARYSF